MKQSSSLLLILFSLLLETSTPLQPSSSDLARREIIRSPTTTTVDPSPPPPTRRGFLSTAATSALGGVGIGLSGGVIAFLAAPRRALAVVPITSEQAEKGIGGGLSRKVRPPPKDKVPRQPLALDFAVMLTRSSYIETAQLEIVPVNQLERDMYLVRTAEYQPYQKATAGAVKQGDLTDPYYFDFMSLVQYLTINRAVQDPQRDFDQMEPITNDDGTQSLDFKQVSIHRTLPDTMLIPTHHERVGNTILSYMDRYKGSGIDLPTFDGKPRLGNDAMLQTFSQLVRLFLVNGFAWEGKAELVPSKVGGGGDSGGGTFRLTLDNPATLWSSQCLAREPLRNDFLRKTAVQLARSMGYTVSSSSAKLQGNSEVTYLTIE